MIRLALEEKIMVSSFSLTASANSRFESSSSCSSASSTAAAAAVVDPGSR
jgi:hypothetical protein